MKQSVDGKIIVTNLVYISLDGMMEPLGESQVVQYLLDLAKKHTIYLLSFEKPFSAEKYATMQKKFSDAGIRWKHFGYSNRYGILSTARQIIQAFFLLKKTIRQKNVALVHARSLIPGLMGLLLKKTSKAKLLFDIRGFALDEKIVDKRLKEKSLLTRTLRAIETYVYQQSDHIVTLTLASKPIIEKKYSIDPKKISVIPTCANTMLFYCMKPEEKIQVRASLRFKPDDIIVLHNGSLNQWVDFEAELQVFSALAKKNPRIKFLILNKGQHQKILSEIENFPNLQGRYHLHSADFSEINRYLNCADLCVFFIKPSFAKKASAPTKFAELVACKIPSITNTQYGDVEYYLQNYSVGLAFDLEEIRKSPTLIAEKALTLIEENKKNSNSECFSKLYSEHFSKELAVKRYSNIYEQLDTQRGSHQ